MANQAIIIALPNNLILANELVQILKVTIGSIEIRKFPDNETYVKINSDVKNKIVFVVDTLDKPDDKLLPLLFVTHTLKKQGAKMICLVAPYLPYMRQDKQFKTGEALTSAIFADTISKNIDCLITIDPHLHRIKNLSTIYPIPRIITLHAIKPIAEWILQSGISPFIIGPDKESAQWVQEIAKLTKSPFITITKTRLADEKVTMEIPEIIEKTRTPVLIDDIISTGISMITAIKELKNRNLKKPFCIAIHAIFSDNAYEKLTKAGVEKIITCNTIIHPSNAINIIPLIADAIQDNILKIN